MDGRTLEFYETHGKEWAASHPPGKYGRELDSFLNRLPAGGTVLELGCGDGRDAQRMIECGFEARPSDGSPAMAALVSARLGREVPVMQFYELEAEAEFDGVWCQSSLLHLPEDELPGVLARIYRAFKPSGWHWASYKGGNGGGRDQFGRFFSYLPAERLEAAYRAAGDWMEFTLTSGDGFSFGGAPTPWHNVLARK